MSPHDADMLQFLAINGAKQELMAALATLTEDATIIRPKMSPGQALELRRRQLVLLQRKDMAELLHVTPMRYNDFLQGHRLPSKVVIARAYALGVRVEPLLEIEKPRSIYFSL